MSGRSIFTNDMEEIERLRAINAALLAALKEAVEAHGPWGNEPSPAWWPSAVAALELAEQAGLK